MSIFRRSAAAALGSILLISGMTAAGTSANAATKIPQVSCATDIQGSKVVATCRGAQANVAYRAVATCLMGNGVGTFTRYGKWEGVGMPVTSVADCKAKVLNGSVEVSS
ncbi:hypothetical protein ACFXPV_38425 [Streptomyces sp. NPDC059118]|uniref:hypothetical protein n=1 Tax=unclassified Streptomyces TaxID=2593676 RepID=UPI0036BD669D